MTTALEHALSYGQRGWHVLPIKHPSRDTAEIGKKGKRPDGSAVPNGLKDASCDTGKIHQWFGNGTPRNIALRTGEAFDVLDIDGVDGHKALQALIAVYGPLPDTPCVETGGGGLH